MTYHAAKSPKILFKVNAKIKNHLEMIALTLLKAAFKFLNTFAE